MEIAVSLNGLTQRSFRGFKRIAPLALADALLLAGAFSLTYWVRTNRLWADTASYFVLFSILVSIGSLYGFGGYQRIWARTSGHDVSVIIAASVVALSVSLMVDLLITPRPLPLSVVLISNWITLNGFVAVRYRSPWLAGWRGAGGRSGTRNSPAARRGC
jgi:FlaA1/EpsC-like NDP-sugar epimerase